LNTVRRKLLSKGLLGRIVESRKEVFQTSFSLEIVSGGLRSGRKSCRLNELTAPMDRIA
jgi:hypothetical protein